MCPLVGAICFFKSSQSFSSGEDPWNHRRLRLGLLSLMEIQMLVSGLSDLCSKPVDILLCPPTPKFPQQQNMFFPSLLIYSCGRKELMQHTWRDDLRHFWQCPNCPNLSRCPTVKDGTSSLLEVDVSSTEKTASLAHQQVVGVLKSH